MKATKETIDSSSLSTADIVLRDANVVPSFVRHRLSRQSLLTTIISLRNEEDDDSDDRLFVSVDSWQIALRRKFRLFARRISCLAAIVSGGRHLVSQARRRRQRRHIHCLCRRPSMCLATRSAAIRSSEPSVTPIFSDDRNLAESRGSRRQEATDSSSLSSTEILSVDTISVRQIMSISRQSPPTTDLVSRRRCRRQKRQICLLSTPA